MTIILSETKNGSPLRRLRQRVGGRRGGGIRPSASSGASRQQKVEAKAYKSACVIAC